MYSLHNNGYPPYGYPPYNQSAYLSMGGYPGASLYGTQHHGTFAFIFFSSYAPTNHMTKYVNFLYFALVFYILTL
jgi:hypothetical protein